MSMFYFFIFFVFSVVVNAQLGAPGDIAFTAYTSSDKKNAFAFVLLKDIEASQNVFFSSDDWNEDHFIRPSGPPNLLKWSPTNSVSAGTVIIFTGIRKGQPTVVSSGKAWGDARFKSTATLYAYVGKKDVPSAFLAAIGNDASLPLGGTGLKEGETAIAIGNRVRTAEFNVSHRNDLTSYGRYAELVNRFLDFWEVEEGNNSCCNGKDPDLPFVATSFTLRKK